VPKLEPIPSLPGRLGSRRGRAVRVSSSLAEINVVPLVDVMLVLLVIFMVAAPMMQQGFAVALPKVRQAQPIKTEPVTVTVPASVGRDGKVWLGNEAVELKNLPERVRQALAGRLKREVILAGDGRVTYGQLMSVIDKLKEARVENLDLKTQPVPVVRQP
jgi:biopolymer transport protein ExbD